MKKFSRIFSYLKDYKLQISGYFITIILQVVFSVFTLAMLAPALQVLFSNQPLTTSSDKASFVQRVSDVANKFILEHEKTTSLLIIIGVAVGFTFLKNLFIYLSLCILNPIRNAVIRRLRHDLFLKTLSLPIGFFTEERKGDLISRMTNDVNEVQQSIVSTLEVFIKQSFTILFFLASMIIISPQMTLSLVMLLPVALLIGRIGKSLRKHSNAVQEQLGKMMSVLDETIAGMRVVKSFNAEAHQESRFAEINNSEFRIRNSIAYRRELGSPISETMGVMIVGAVLWYGGNLIFKQQTSPEWLFTFIAMFSQIINPFKELSASFLNIEKGSAALNRIEELLNTENTIKNLPNAKPIDDFKENIEFKNVSFYYGDKKILNNLNVVIPKGKTIALVGASGAGKSTMVDMIPRFHDVTDGEVLVDGVSVRDYKLYDLRKLMGVVNQDPILFNDSIYSNIAMGSDDATEEQVKEAAIIAHADEFIRQKSEGYETIVGDRGSRLSGGERQRVTIARAVLKNPPILILDEATSSLDTQSERIVQDAINRLMQQRTCIVIAHRLSTVQNAHEILVLEKGSIIERGTHEDLIHKNGTYKKLVEMQQVK